jgi:transcriptional regulator GlxA family with amidase domain
VTTCGLLLFDEVEVLDATGPFQVLTTAGRLGAPIQVATVAARAGTIVARGGLGLLASHTIVDSPELDLLIVPGGVTEAVECDEAVLHWIAGQRRYVPLTLSICTGALILAAAGQLDGRPVVTHWEDEAELARRWPTLNVHKGVRWIDDGDLVTSAGISAGIDASLHVVDRLFGRPLADRTARQMDYDWKDTP